MSKTNEKVHSAEKIEELQKMEKKLQIWKKMEVKDPKAYSSSTSSSTTPGKGSTKYDISLDDGESCLLLLEFTSCLLNLSSYSGNFHLYRVHRRSLDL